MWSRGKSKLDERGPLFLLMLTPSLHTLLGYCSTKPLARGPGPQSTVSQRPFLMNAGGVFLPTHGASEPRQ